MSPDFYTCERTSIHTGTHSHTNIYVKKNVIKLVKTLILASFLVVETKYFDKGNLGEKEFIRATVPGYSWNTVPWWGSHRGGAHNRWSHPFTV